MLNRTNEINQDIQILTDAIQALLRVSNDVANKDAIAAHMQSILSLRKAGELEISAQDLEENQQALMHPFHQHQDFSHFEANPIYRSILAFEQGDRNARFTPMTGINGSTITPPPILLADLTIPKNYSIPTTLSKKSQEFLLQDINTTAKTLNTMENNITIKMSALNSEITRYKILNFALSIYKNEIHPTAILEASRSLLIDLQNRVIELKNLNTHSIAIHTALTSWKTVHAGNQGVNDCNQIIDTAIKGLN